MDALSVSYGQIKMNKAIETQTLLGFRGHLSNSEDFDQTAQNDQPDLGPTLSDNKFPPHTHTLSG